MIRFIILGLLNIKPMSAYDFDKMLTESIKSFYDIKQSQIYIEFKKLEKEELLVNEEIFSKETKRTKKVYKITDKGRTYFFEKSESLDQSVERYLDIKAVFLVRMFFGEILSDEINLKFLMSLKKKIIEKINETKEKQKMIDNIQSKNELIDRKKWYWASTVNYGIVFYGDLLTWTNSCIRSIRNKVWNNK